MRSLPVDGEQPYLRRALGVCGTVLCLTGLYACAVSGVGVDGSVGVGYTAGYYEPYGYDYGGWGGGYRVAPWHGGGYEHRDHPHFDRAPPRPAYRPAPRDHGPPSIPGGPHHR
jgi:hypothetical protein